ncbi:dTDP-glucose pyrophosphorylase [Crossiella equi]|uniref:dTDP-glucose pyrophosphorylase n=1 Tax=Crossiella equi TaxID=130796 RepID=A0ABS5A5C7_9PSEU|nr:hypothetical protein [Crossiella equi]MBP2471452.1 dTDP-glucose pyrophosphorylase [Crossiella equi]
MAEPDSTGPDTTVVLPCAGVGSRFSAAYPKELHSVSPGVAVVDLALESAVALVEAGRRVRVVVVLGPHKLATAGYLHRYAERFDLVFVYQTERHGPGLAGAVGAALPLCVGDTVLLLPDQVLRGDEARAAVPAAVSALDGPGWAVVAARAGGDGAALAEEGALLVPEHGPGRVLDAREKPGADAGRFNAAWAVVAVGPEQRHRLADVVRAGADNPLVGAAVVLVPGFDNVTDATRLGEGP